MEDADLIIAVFDASRELTEEDYEIINLIKERKSLVLLNKTDLPSKYTVDFLEGLISNKM